MPKLKWTVEVEVEQSWVADGFVLTDERAKEMLAKALPFAHNSELGARVLTAPPAEKIAKLQGYNPKKPETWPQDLKESAKLKTA